GVFPRASSGYSSASSGGPEVVGHNFVILQYTTSSAAVSESNAGGATASALETHSHPGSSTITGGTTDIRPPSTNPHFIQANTTTIPNGAIGMFDVADTSSLPSAWTYYSNMDARYLRGGENVTSTGGSAEHTHTINATTTSGSGSATPATTGGAATA